MKILLVGDIVGKGGRRAACKLIPRLRTELGCCYCIANGENVAGGAGLTAKCVEELKSNGVDTITTGDHIWDQKDFVNDVKRYPYVLRPANFSLQQPGRGYGIYNIPIGGTICVINVIGRVFIGRSSDNPFDAVDRILDEMNHRTKIIFVDFHGEATSEKIAMGRHLDGRVTAVFGTHTHVPTADSRVFPGGTAFQCDLGMVGSRQSIIGRDINSVVASFKTGMPARFKVIDKDIELNGAVVEFDPTTGRAKHIERVYQTYDVA